jgi:Fe-S-cluster-containing dehydrogenase component/anaerobic selenocysteine-containing dehydrogenase
MKLAAIGGTGLVTETGARKAGKLVPYVVPPENISPVIGSTIATVCRECPAGCGMHVRHVNGRITKAEGNPVHPVNRGRLCPRGQSALQGIYDPDRVKSVQARERSGPFRQESWQNAIAAVSGRLQKTAGRIAMLSRLETGTLSEIMSAFLSAFGSDRLLLYEPFHYAPLRKAHGTLFGQAVIPFYHLDQCRYILSFGADFLETWVSNVQFASQFSEMHSLKNGAIGRFDYIGPRLSMTAANADRYIAVQPGRERDIALALLRMMLDEGLVRSGLDLIQHVVRNFDINTVADRYLSRNELRGMARRFGRGKSVALGGPLGAPGPDAEELALVTALLNVAAGSIGTVIDFSRPHALSRTADDDQVNAFLTQLTSDDVLVIHRANPVYTRPGSEEYLRKAGMIVYLGTMPDETAAMADWFLPVHDDLESWGEYEPWAGVSSLMQPTMQALNDSREAGDILISLAAAAQKALKKRTDGSNTATVSDWLQDRWKTRFPQAEWKDSLRNGGSWPSAISVAGKGPGLRATTLPSPADAVDSPLKNDEAYLWLWPSIMLFDGRIANRGWMQEAPEPVSTITWGSWIDLNPKKAQVLNIRSGDVLELIAENKQSIEAPARITEEVAQEAVAVCFGQGHSALGALAADCGANAFKLVSTGQPEGMFGRVLIRKTGRREKPAISMTTKDQHDRELLRWAHLEEAGAMKPGPLVLPLAESYAKGRDLYQPHEHKKHRWAMTIDLQRCIGCGACAVACYAENNIPVVGKKQVMKGRHIPWLRVVPYRRHENDSLRVGWLPMLCQHCDQAPCEPVCPVFAAVHNEEGLNSQVYNRCIGTRYCSNNCPYKVRRFNWVNIRWEEPLTRQLNPEVTVRVRGVMEKCTFCVQRIRNAEYRARRENRKVRDGEIVPACAQTCPANVFTFGDLLDPESQVSRITRNDPRRYHVLEELNTKPAITYLYRILQEKTQPEIL